MLKGFLIATSTFVFSVTVLNAQPLTMSEAVRTGWLAYPLLHAKANYARAAGSLVEQARSDYLPNITPSAQQAYGTVNGQFGPLGPYGAAGVSSSGPVASGQNWTAVFGSSYLVNTNWEVFTFGRVSSHVRQAQAQARRDSADLAQETFVHGVRVASAYLDLLTAQRFVTDALQNLDRAAAIRGVVIARTRNGLNAGVDSSIANAQLSQARIALINAQDNEHVVSSRFARLLNSDAPQFLLDSSFFSSRPAVVTSGAPPEEHPELRFYRERVNYSNATADYVRKSVLPGVNLFGVFQSRGSGLEYSYVPGAPGNLSKDYFSGVIPNRANYVAGVSLSWNILSPLKIRGQARYQDFVSRGLQDEYELQSTRLKDESILADQRIATGLERINEAPVQLKAAQDAYLQKSVLYRNGLVNIIDLQQALIALNRAELDYSVASVNVWQALLQKAAATGDFNLFLNQVR